ncbi:flagellar hook-associated protein 2 [Paucimonas lemoignei]|uniref:Flagellar hook-associated protein 2 n=1 Tax=Paucimonas lemoignei TaxID=29443 RepID=A0A4R3I2F2_PAULE|nr:flagellar filament capping protein FliD [Paucimonas lemoignei]TCS39193.1 flagellar hook-associated protein 2 [Paucimonas lemoignei]
MALSSPGIGSNLDINSIVSQLMMIEQQPLTKIAKQEASYQAKLSAIGSIKSALSSFQTAVNGLSDISKFQATKVTAGDTAVASATGSGSATPGTYALEVAKLAQAQKLASAGQSSTSAAIGTGTITIDFGTISGGSFDSVTGKYTGASFASNGAGSKTITIGSGDNSLAGIRDAINKAGIGVTANIVNDGGTSPYRLVLSNAATGQANSMKISVTGDAGLQALLNHDPAAEPASQAFTETVTAQNAEFKVDGVSISKPGNSVNDVIQGVTLSLYKTNAGSPTNITVARDTSAVSGAVGQFVAAYNKINATLNQLSAYDPETKTAAVLNGDATLRSIQTQIRGVLGTAVENNSGAFNRLSDIGVALNKDGTLALDNAKLQKAMEKNFSDIADLFAATGKASDSLISYTGSTSKTGAGSYSINITQLATQGRTVGQGAAGLTIDASNDTLEVKLDGVTTTIKLSQATYANATALAAEIQGKINGASEFSAAGATVKVSSAGGILSIVSDRYGSASNVEIVSGNGLANLLGGGQTATTGLDVAGTLNGVAATGAGQTLTGAKGSPTEGLKLTITGGALGDRGTINLSRGYASKFDSLLTSLLDTKGPLTSRTDGLNATLKSLSDQKERISDRLIDIEKRYRAQFTALDVAIASMSQTSNYLAQQLANLPKFE